MSYPESLDDTLLILMFVFDVFCAIILLLQIYTHAHKDHILGAFRVKIKYPEVC